MAAATPRPSSPSTGVVIVDTKLAEWGQRIMDQISSVTDKPVTHDHQHAYARGSHRQQRVLPGVGRGRRAGEHQGEHGEDGRASRGDKAQFLPDKTFKDKMTLFSGADQIDLYYFGAGHTNGDAVVVFPALRVAHAGDLFARKGTPLIDTNNGGSGVAYPETVKKAAEKHQERRQRDHRPQRRVPVERRGRVCRVQQGVPRCDERVDEAGKSADDTIAAFKMPDKFKDYNMAASRTTSPRFTPS